MVAPQRVVIVLFVQVVVFGEILEKEETKEMKIVQKIAALLASWSLEDLV